ncbi:MAG: hypothetical protein WBO29_05990 [Albidovulum sp.]
MALIITKFSKPPRYKTPNFREKHLRNVTVDSEGRVYLFNKEASPLTPAERFHFFEEVLAPDDWERVRAYYSLPKTRRRSNKSGGVRRHEGHLIGLNPKRPIKDIQDERGKEAGEKSGRMPAYGKAFERMVKKDIAARGPQTDDELLANWPTRNDDKANPFDPSEDDDVPF